jgi:exonuclease V gamma subunit
MLSRDLPPDLGRPTNGRHRAGAGQDNLVLPYQGLRADALADEQRDRLMALIDSYLARWPDGHREHEREQVLRHLDDTWFAWIGDTRSAPFYYRVHSPVILIELDHHPGILLDNDEPEPFHVHTIVRTPNGGDYGMHLV